MNISYKKLWKLLIDRDMKKEGSAKGCGHQQLCHFQNDTE